MHIEVKAGCSVISSMNCHNANILKYVDYHLHLIAKQKALYVKNSRFSEKVRESKRYTWREPSSHIRHKVAIYKYSK